MRSIDGMDRAAGETDELGRPPTPCHLTAEELGSAVAAQLEQRAEQGFAEVPLTVLSRLAQIVATVRWEVGPTVATPCSENPSMLDRAA